MIGLAYAVAITAAGVWLYREIRGPPAVIFSLTHPLPVFCVAVLLGSGLRAWVFPMARRRYGRHVVSCQYRICPTCGYNLTGLPSVHVCPECRTAYDEAELRQIWNRFLEG